MDSIADVVESEKNYKCKPDETFGAAVRKRFYEGREIEGEEKLLADFIMNYYFCMRDGADPDVISAKYLS